MRGEKEQIAVYEKHIGRSKGFNLKLKDPRKGTRLMKLMSHR